MGIRQMDDEWKLFIQEKYNELVNCKPIAFQNIIPSMIPTISGVYLITAKNNGYEEPYYIGRSMNLRQRIYNNHLMGPVTNARLKKYLIGSGECKDLIDAKEFIKAYCSVRWIFEDDTRRRGAIEGYITGVLFPKYGIYQEH